ncbi:MAG: hypothetical protein WDM89_06245 [Rhizomicrobium sp.]
MAGAVGMGAPVFRSGHIVGALCLTIPEARFKPAMETRYAQILRSEANKLSVELG